jgi:hypothetical protein
MLPPLGTHVYAVPIGPRWEIRNAYKADQCETDLQKWIKTARDSMTKETAMWKTPTNLTA